MRHQNRRSLPLGVLSRAFCLQPALGESRKLAHWPSFPTVPKPGRRRGSLSIMCTCSRATDLWEAMQFYHPYSGADSCTCLASCGPWQSLKVTAFLSFPLTIPAAVPGDSWYFIERSCTRRASEGLTHCQLPQISFTRCNCKNLKILSDKMSLLAYLL